MRRAVLLAVLAGIALADGGHDQDVDYPQVGGGTYRTYTNTQETLLTLRSLKAIPAGTPKLKTTFSAPVAGASFASPVILTEVSGENNEVDIAYFGTTAGYFYAINSLNGNLIYSLNPTQLQLVNPVPTCPIAAGSPIGRPIALIGGTAAADEGLDTVFFVAGGNLYGVDIGSGSTKSKIAGQFALIKNLYNPALSFNFGGLNLDTANKVIYVATAGACEFGSPYTGQIIAVPYTTASNGHFSTVGTPQAFNPISSSQGYGAGMYALGGVNNAPVGSSSFIFAGTGNSFLINSALNVPVANQETFGYAEHIIALNPAKFSSTGAPAAGSLTVAASFNPGTGYPAGGVINDVYDFSDTPAVFTPAVPPTGPYCASTLAVGIRKNGEIYVLNAATLAKYESFYLQSGNPDGGLYIATPVYSAITKQLYITLPTTFTANTITGSYTLNQGVAAFTINSDCTLRLQATTQVPATPNTISTPYSQPVVVSNGNNDPFLVFTDGYAGNVYVVDATTLSVVASQSVGASVVSPPTVVNGYIYLTTEVFPTGPAPVSNYLIALEGNF